MSGTTVSRSTRTEKITEDRGEGLKTYVKTIVTETTTTSDGKKTVTTTETESTEEPGASGSSTDGKKEKEKKPQKMKDFIEDVVKAHNKYRKTHAKVGDVKHNKDLTVLAQRWADHLAAVKVLKHSDDTFKGNPLGENVASKWSSAGADYTGQEVVDQWYSEVSKYDFDKGQFMQGTGHFTQVVWKGSKEIGVGKALTSDGRVYVVCNYYPAGNMVGQFGENVFRAK